MRTPIEHHPSSGFIFNRVMTEVKRPPLNLKTLVEEYRMNETDVLLNHVTNDYGWTPNPDVSNLYAKTLPNTETYCQDLRPILDNKPVVLTKIYRDTIGQDPPKGPQGIGDCVSWGNANGINVYQAVQIATGLATFGYEEAMTESIYALARCEIGKQWGSRKDGAVGAWAAKALTTMGCLSRFKYGAYDPKRAKLWGANGLPDDLEPEAKQHLYKTAVQVTSWDQAVPLIQAGIPVVVCSNVGFGSRNQINPRDKDGFAKAQGTWYHCMVFVGARFDREGLLCLQSWGPNVPEGPCVLDQPDNSFWVDRTVVNRMLGQRDSYAYDGGFTGFKPNDAVLDWTV
jgi:hypothetical protein